MALGLVITKVTPLYPRRIFIQWDLLNPTEDGTYTFKIQRSGSSEGEWEMLEPGLQNGFSYVDDFTKPVLDDNAVAHPFSLQRQFYYRVTGIPPSGCTNQAVSEPHSLEPEIPPIQRGLRRKLRYEETRIWKAYNGVRLALLKRRQWGVRCPDCYDDTTKASTKDHCLTCYGTSFVGGYWAPVIVYGRIHPPLNVQAQTTQRDKNESAQQMITTLDVPLLQDDDLIVETDTNQRHIVRRKTQTELKRHPVHQQLTTSLLERGAIEYDLPVDLRATPPLL
jgi:hypothetical protein